MVTVGTGETANWLAKRMPDLKKNNLELDGLTTCGLGGDYDYPSKDAIVMDFYRGASAEMQPKIAAALEGVRVGSGIGFVQILERFSRDGASKDFGSIPSRGGMLRNPTKKSKMSEYTANIWGYTEDSRGSA